MKYFHTKKQKETRKKLLKEKIPSLKIRKIIGTIATQYIDIPCINIYDDGTMEEIYENNNCC